MDNQDRPITFSLIRQSHASNPEEGFYWWLNVHFFFQIPP
jgi:hypothetical protein